MENISTENTLENGHQTSKLSETLTGKTKKNDHPFFSHYGQFYQQQNMLQDDIRTGTYHKAIINNPSNFKNKIVMDVGTGTGILAIFAAHSGAKRVYAVEASASARTAMLLVKQNNLQDVIKVIDKKVEDVDHIIDLNRDYVDVFVSEPMGTCLFHERMLESFVFAREKFGSTKSVMFPSIAKFYVSAFSDEQTFNYLEETSKFWNSDNFYGVSLKNENVVIESRKEIFSQPLISAVDPTTLVSSTDNCSYELNFADKTTTVNTFQEIVMNFFLSVQKVAVIHGLCLWFDTDFVGDDEIITLSTSPSLATTHWYQTRFMLQEPIAVNCGDKLNCKLVFKANDKFSYDVLLELFLYKGTKFEIRRTNFIRLQDQNFNFMTYNFHSTG
eukprot:maker-scaffold_7-snap-gene-3.61-mRNA-1 protein AED:0.01 eAED:0.01 QI:86/1/1/1/1/0.75/4/356/385